MFSFWHIYFIKFSYFIIFLDHGVMVSLIFAAHPPSRRSRPRCVDQLLEAQLSCSNRPTWASEPCWVFRVFPPSDSIFHTVLFHVSGGKNPKNMSLNTAHTTYTTSLMVKPLNHWTILNTKSWSAWQQFHAIPFKFSWPFHHEGLLSHHLPAKQPCTAKYKSTKQFDQSKNLQWQGRQICML